MMEAGHKTVQGGLDQEPEEGDGRLTVCIQHIYTMIGMITIAHNISHVAASIKSYFG